MTTLAIRNPRTGLNDFSIDVCEEPAIKAITASMRSAQPDWQSKTVEQRVEILKRWQQALIDNRSAVIAALEADTGRHNETILEFDTIISTIERWCDLAPEALAEPEQRQSSIPGLSIGSRSQPYAVVGVISPWNFPLLLSLIDAIPALLCGCSTIIKTSEVTPRFVDPVMTSIQAVPELANIIQYVQGDGRTGAALMPYVDMVIFTGSVATGRLVGEAAAKQFIPAFLELGGKDAAIVFDDVDIDRVTAAIAWGGLANAGQSCLSIERVYVAQSIFEAFVTKLTERVESLRLSFDDPEQGDIGPVISEKQAAILQAHIGDAVAKGATINCGGMVEKKDGGLWCHPTVLTAVDHSMRVMSDESFGPLLPVQAFADEEEAIRLANDSPFGLSAAVFSDDPQRITRVVNQLDAGAISINDCALTAIMHEGEKQSFKLSGLGGSRMGPASLRRFVRKKALLINDQKQWDSWWFHSAETDNET